jgi:hypothetical protein
MMMMIGMMLMNLHKWFVCDKCGYITDTRIGYLQHIAKMHKNKKEKRVWGSPKKKKSLLYWKQINRFPK